MKRSVQFHASTRTGRFIGVTALIVGTMSTLVLGLAAPAANAATRAPASRLNRLPMRGAAAPTRATAPAQAQAPKPAGSRWTQANEITGSGDALFGYSVAISGTTMVVGAASDNSGTGAAFVYTGSGSSWTQVAELTPSDGVNGDFFGTSVALTSTAIVVGSECHSTAPLSCEGAAYVFTNGGTYAQQAELIDPGQASDDFFGSTVSMSSNSVLVGASGENANEGAVFVYTEVASVWPTTPTATLTEPGGSSGDNDLFGYDVAVKSTTMVVGAPETPGTSTGAGTGAAYVFKNVGGAWIEKAKLAASNGEGCVTTCSAGVNYIGGDYFGYSVAIHGKTVAVGAPFASVPPATDGVGTGAAYVFTGSGASWTQKNELSDPAEVTAGGQDWFGFDVALLGSSIVVTAPYDFQGAATGAAYVFPKHAGTWSTYPTELTALDGAPGDYFGWNGLATIGRKYVVVGSPYSTDGGVYFFLSS